MHSRIGMTVDGSCFGGNEQLTAVRSKAVAVELLEWTLAGSSRIEQHFYRFACLERVFDDLCLIRIHLRIMFAVSRNRDDTRNVLRNKFSGYDFFQIELPCHFGRNLPAYRGRGEVRCLSVSYLSFMLICFHLFSGNKYTTKGRFIEAVGRFYSF